MDISRALALLHECTGDEIWPVELCLQKGIPETWIEELQDCFESGFDSDRNTIYDLSGMVNQFHGVLDVQLAYKLAEYLGVDTSVATASALGRRAEVQALKDAVVEL